MAWSRTWRVDSRERWQSVLRALLSMQVDFSRHPVEIVVQEERRDKTHDMRKLFHALCAELAPHLGLTPGQVKEAIKVDFYGAEVVTVAGKVYTIVQSSEASDREEYSRLIDHAYQWGAEAGVEIQDRRA